MTVELYEYYKCGSNDTPDSKKRSQLTPSPPVYGHVIKLTYDITPTNRPTTWDAETVPWLKALAVQ